VSPLGVAALALLALAGALLTTGALLRRSPTWSGALLGAGVGAALLGGYLVVTGRLAPGSAVVAEPRNPFPASAESLARGRTLYAAHCQSCHGAAGAGDGPAAAGLDAPGLDLRAGVGARSDARLFRTIGQGLRGTAMPAFIGRLTEEERWHLVTYIRTLDATKPGG
jgi:mono/diheme cytochrome c family protein